MTTAISGKMVSYAIECLVKSYRVTLKFVPCVHSECIVNNALYNDAVPSEAIKSKAGDLIPLLLDRVLSKLRSGAIEVTSWFNFDPSASVGMYITIFPAFLGFTVGVIRE